MTALRTLFVLFCATALHADLRQVQAEPDLEKRSQAALEHAGDELEAARKAYSDGNLSDFKRHVGEVGELAEISYKSLQETGKKARKNPKWFKRAELALRSLLRRVDSFEKDVSLDDRDMLAGVRERVQAVHENVLHDIMTKK